MPRVSFGRRSTAADAPWHPPERRLEIRIPAISTQVRNEVARRITSNQPWLHQKSLVDQAKLAAQRAREAERNQVERLQALKHERTEALEDVQQVRETQLQESLGGVKGMLERQLEGDFRSKQNESEREWKVDKQTMEDEITARRDAYEEKLRTADLKDDEDDNGPPLKRAKLTEEGEAGDEAKDEEEGDEAKAAVTEVEDAPKPSDAKRAEYDVAKEKLDAIGESKSRMVWLLKQVIKAEAKLK